MDWSAGNTERWVRRAQQQTEQHPLSRKLFSPDLRMPQHPAALLSTQRSARALVFNCSFLSFCHKGSFPKPSVLQQPHPCAPQPGSDQQRLAEGEIPLENRSASASFWPKFEAVLWSWQSFLIYYCYIL